jgi:hypothetical protein
MEADPDGTHSRDSDLIAFGRSMHPLLSSTTSSLHGFVWVGLASVDFCVVLSLVLRQDVYVVSGIL